MKNTTVQLTDVVGAYVALMKQRRRPSLLNIRLELGRGSYSTIAAHLERLSFVRNGERFQRTKKKGRPKSPLDS